MLLYMWTCGIDERNALFDQEIDRGVQWCASLERAVDEASANIRHYLDSGVSPKDVDNVGIFSVEFDPTPDNIVALLEAGHILQGTIYSRGSYATRMRVDARITPIKTIMSTEIKPT